MKKSLSIVIVLAFIFSPVFAIAQTYDVSNAQRAIVVPETSSQAYQARVGTTGSSGTGGSGAAAQSLGGCAVGSMLSGLLKSSVSSLTSSLNPSDTDVRVNETRIRAKEVGDLGNLGVSWDSIGFCLINSIIQYIGQSTVQWINSGFQGNPVFVDNPEQFFSDIADLEAGRFLGEISNGYLCSPIQAPVRLNIANTYNNSISPYSNRGRCTFSGISGNMESFLSGNSFSWQDWISYSRPSNNTYGATVSAQLELDKRIASALGTESKLLDWGRGFLSFKDPETGKISSPGTIIEGQINSRLGSSERRIEMADEFDEVVNALVNQLIKIAISEITDSGSRSGGTGSSYYYGNSYNNQTTDTTNNSGGIVNDLYDDTVLLCRYDLGAQESDNIQYTGDCFPSRWMQFDYVYSYQIPIRATYCDLPDDIEADSDEAKDYYNGNCVPPTKENTDFIEENNLLGKY